MSRIRDKIALMKCGALLLFGAVLLRAQTPSFEIRGTVSEPGLGGIAGVLVRALAQDELRGVLSETGLSIRAPGTSDRIATTNARGEFVIRPSTSGQFELFARREGYSLALDASYRASVSAAQPRAEVELAMVRRGGLTGRVLDADTRQPVEGLEMRATVRYYKIQNEIGIMFFGMLPVDQTVDQSRLKTDRDGNFAYGNVMPGEYIATPAVLNRTQMSAGFSEAEGKIVDETYVVDGEPIARLNSGGFASFGNIFMKKAPQYRVHVSLPQGDCPLGESVRVALLKRGQQPSREARADAAFACGSELLVRNVDPGSYVLYAVSDWQGERDHVENTVWGLAPLEVVDKNLDVSIPLQRGVILEGQLVAAEGLNALPEHPGITAQSGEVIDGARPIAEQFIEWGEDGKFRMAIPARPQIISARTSGAYVKQVRYNGIALPDMILPVNPGTGAHHVEIVFDDKYGSLTGTVLEGTRPAPQSILILQREGSDSQESAPVEAGTIRMQALVPGEYRVMAIRQDVMASRVEMTKDAQKVIIRAGETATINVQLTGASK